MLTMSSESPASIDSLDHSDGVAAGSAGSGSHAGEASLHLRFLLPLLGFEHLFLYTIQRAQKGPFHWLQSTEDTKVGFCLLEPFQTHLDVDMEISIEDIADLGAVTADEITVLTMLVLDQDPTKIRTNLRAPILVCRRTGLAKQMVFTETKLPIQFYLKDLMHLAPNARRRT